MKRHTSLLFYFHVLFLLFASCGSRVASVASVRVVCGTVPSVQCVASGNSGKCSKLASLGSGEQIVKGETERLRDESKRRPSSINI